VGLGRDEPTALKEAVATGYPREKMYGVWWSGAEPDVKDVGAAAKGYNALMMQHGAEPQRQGRQGHPEGSARQGPGHRAEGRSRPGAVHARRDGRDAGRRRRARARRSVRQGQGHDRRAGPLGLREPEPDQKKLDALGFKPA
jgi:branched-chain amino acid transport system substrate-binding protein